MTRTSFFRKILLLSYRFPPDVGGIESIGRIICQELIQLGYQVTVLTASGTQGREEYIKGVMVIRKPRPIDFIQSVNEADIIFHNNISLSLGWLGFCLLKPQVVRHATWIGDSGKVSITSLVKMNLLRMTHNIANSQAVAQHLPVPSVVIGNPYDSEQFRVLENVPRELDLVFVGRLVSDKGVDLLLEALSMLDKIGLKPSTTIVGGGPEEDNLKKMTWELGLDERVRFVGFHQGIDLVVTLNAHRILVVPSRWLEPFGIVALEGIACGCVVVGSEGGGLKDAIGSCGLTFPNGDVAGLARCLELLLRDPIALATYRAAASQHLQVHHPRSVVQRYLQVMEAAFRRHSLPTGASDLT